MATIAEKIGGWVDQAKTNFKRTDSEEYRKRLILLA